MISINSKLKRMIKINSEVQCMINIRHTFNVNYIQQSIHPENIYQLISHLIFCVEECRNLKLV